MTTDTAAVRQFIKQHYNDDEFEALAFDFFPDVAGDFTGNMTLGRKIQLLLQYAKRQDDRWERLLGALERTRPQPYQQKLADLSSAPPVSDAAAPTPIPPAARNPRQIFLSHAHQDAELANRLAADLRAEGWDIWLAPDSIRPGEMWAEAIDRGLDESGVFLLLLSPAAVSSKWVRKETYMAIEMEQEDLLQFLPVLIKRCNPPRMWRTVQWLDFTGRYDREALLASLAGPARPGAVGAGTQSDAAAGGVRAVEGDAAGRDIYKAARDIHIHQYPAGPPESKPEPASARPKPEVSAFQPISRVKDPPPKQDVPPEHVPGSLVQWDDGRYYHRKTGMEMVYVPAGEFLYGEEKEERTLPAFWVSRTSVTNAQYKLFLDANPDHQVPSGGHDWANWDPAKRMFPDGRADHPVVRVSWQDATAYCEWAGLQLPTEERWEKAARGTDGREYPWGSEQPTDRLCNFNDNVGVTTPVGDYSPQGDSPFGCVDMAGNVWDWTKSWYDAKKLYRVLRGGSFASDYWDARAANRNNGIPDFRVSNVGFRVVEHLSDSDF